jgi:hypothetical protein
MVDTEETALASGDSYAKARYGPLSDAVTAVISSLDVFVAPAALKATSASASVLLSRILLNTILVQLFPAPFLAEISDVHTI